MRCVAYMLLATKLSVQQTKQAAREQELYRQIGGLKVHICTLNMFGLSMLMIRFGGTFEFET